MILRKISAKAVAVAKENTMAGDPASLSYFLQYNHATYRR
jgi:hypothetical protein